MRRIPSVPKPNAPHPISSHIPAFTSQRTRALDPCARLQSVPKTNAPQYIPSHVSTSAHAQCELYPNGALQGIPFEHVRPRREGSMASRVSKKVVGGSSGHAGCTGALRSSACSGGKAGFWHRRAWCLRRSRMRHAVQSGSAGSRVWVRRAAMVKTSGWSR